MRHDLSAANAHDGALPNSEREPHGVPQAEHPIDRDSGILVFRASRLEALLEPLELLLHAQRPAQVLAPQTIVAAHPGMKHWLVSAMARRRGSARIVANLDVLLVSDWLDDLAQSILGKNAVAVAPWQRAALRWRIHELLPELQDTSISAFLSERDAPRRRYQLADRLAHLFGQYMTYRPDWLQAWQRGKPAGPRSFQAELWQRLHASIGIAHRAERIGALVQRLQQQSHTENLEPLHLFGMSHLAPAEMHVLHALARVRPVAIYVPDPCREYWGGLRTERSQLQAMAEWPVDDALQEHLLQLDHPLLAQWGRMGQHFMLALNQGEEDLRVDTRHWGDLSDPPLQMSRLHRVQESVRRLEQASLLNATTLLATNADEDSSLRIHACHTPLRELEVLRDALLQALKDDPKLLPSDIVVMAPDISRYAPLLPALFGGATTADTILPFAIADGARLRSHPIFAAFESLLTVPDARLTAPQVADLLSLPAVARRLGLHDEHRQQLMQWLTESRVAWGLDGPFKQAFDIPPSAEHSFAWAMDRMIAGYVLGANAADQSIAFDGILPLQGVNGPGVEALGALDQLLQVLADIHRETQQPRTASAWVRQLGHWLDQVFDSRGVDKLERAAIEDLQKLILNLELETAQAEVDPQLSFVVVQEYLRQALASIPEQPRWLRGGITFCGMVPQRSIPFQVIAVLGLNEGDFPRAPRDAQLDLMQQQRRLGDRDVRDDDRYLFLETLMAARSMLHLSFIGEGVRDGRPRNPAAPLAELLEFLEQAAGIQPAAKTDSASIPWLIRHPLQPFDRRYFDASDPRLFSFRTEFAEMTRADISASDPIVSPVVGVLPTSFRVATMKSFFKDPARTLCTHWLKLRLDALEEDRLSEREPLEAKTSAIDRVARRLFFDALLQQEELPDVSPDWLRLSGMLATGALGECAWAVEREKAALLLNNARTRVDLQAVDLKRKALRVDIALQGFHISGELNLLFETSQTLMVLDAFPGKEAKALGFRERLPFFVEWALLRLHHRNELKSIRAVAICAGNAGAEDDDFVRALNSVDRHLADAGTDRAQVDCIHADIEQRLGALLRIMQSSLQQGLRYLPKTSAALLGVVEAQWAETAETAWQGGDFWGGERDYAPGYAQWLLRDLSFLEQPQILAEFAHQASALQAIIMLDSMECLP